MSQVSENYITEECIEKLQTGDSWLTDIYEDIILDIAFTGRDGSVYMFKSKEIDYPFNFKFTKEELPNKIWRCPPLPFSVEENSEPGDIDIEF